MEAKRVASWKRAILVAGVLSIVAVGSAFAHDRSHEGGGGEHFTAEDRSAFLDARIAALKAGLRLTAAQQASWPAFEQALRNVAQVRAERMQAAGGPPPSDPIDRLDRRANALTRIGTALKQLADAAKPLYQSFDDGQKRRFVILARFLRPQHGRWSHFTHHGGRDRPDSEEPGEPAWQGQNR
jgi:zinc resistance-associated protein